MKLRAADQKVLRASRELSPTHKLVVADTAALDGRDHAFISAARQALRLGLAEETIKEARSYLQSIGLLKRHQRPGGRWEMAWSWEVIWLPEWRPKGEEPTDEVAVKLAGVLDAFIRRARAGQLKGGSDPPQQARVKVVETTPQDAVLDGGQVTPSRAQVEGGKHTPSPAEPRSGHDGGVRGGLTSQNQVEQPSPFSPAEKDLENGEAFTRDKGEKGEPEEPGLAEFRETRERLRRGFPGKPTEPNSGKPRQSGQPTLARDVVAAVVPTAADNLNGAAPPAPPSTECQAEPEQQAEEPPVQPALRAGTP